MIIWLRPFDKNSSIAPVVRKRIEVWPAHSEIPMARQCELLDLSRSSFHYLPTLGERLSLPDHQHKRYPYLLKGKTVDRPDAARCADIAYIRFAHGFVYLVAILDWHSGYVLAWSLSTTLEKEFCLEALPKPLRIPRPEIFNTDQGTQFTSPEFTGLVERAGIRISMGGRR